MLTFIKRSFHYIFFRAAVPGIKVAKTRSLDESDLPPLPQIADPGNLSEALMKVRVDSGLSLIWGIGFALRKKLTVSFILALLYAACLLSGPLLVFQLVEFVGDAAAGKLDISVGLKSGLLLCLAGSLTGLFQHHYFYNCLQLSQSIISALNMRIYRHGILLKRQARMNRQTGDIVNLIGTDTDILSFAQFEMTELLMRLIMLIVAAFMLVDLMGYAGLAGLLTLLLLVPLARKIAKTYLKLDDQIMEFRDERVSIMSSILSGIRIVKYFAWEGEMRKEVEKIRAKEIKTRRKLFDNTARSTFIYYGASLLVGFVSFMVALALGHDLDTPALFSSLALFGLLESTIGNLSELISIIASGKVSADRIASFLREPICEVFSEQKCSWTALKLEHAHFRFEDGEQDVLKNLNLTIKSGETIAILGSVGAGKSALLQALLGEVPLVHGSMSWVSGSRPQMAYVPQEALVLNGSLRDNIELGLSHDDMKLKLAIEAAQLAPDLEQISGGLAAEIGEQGINLSGGQKQRVNLARAARREADIFLLDDPISAVDFHTENGVMNDLIFGLWKDKTRIFVTHRLHHLKKFDRILLLQDGRIIGDGSFEELDNHNAAFRIFRQRSETSHDESLERGHDSKEANLRPTEVVRITDEEDRALGSVDLAVYGTYAKAWLGPNKKSALFLLILLSLFAFGLPALQQSWIAYWADHSQEFDLSLKQVLYIWGALGFLGLMATLLFQRMWLIKAQSAGILLHERALLALLRSPLNYFDRTPIGRILNRFSRDMDSVEREIASNLERTIAPILHSLAAVFIMSFAVPWLILVILPAFLAYYFLQKMYRSASRDSQRLTSIARSPRFAFFKESLQASTLVRAHNQTDEFVRRYESLLRNYQRCFHGSIMFNRWFSSRIPMLGATITFGLIAAILWLASSGEISAGVAGLSLVYALKLCDYLNNAIRSFTVVESSMIGVERLESLAMLPSEVEPDPQGVLSESTVWPSEGHIQLENVSVRYAQHLPFVLKNCSLQIEAQQKLGIIGRTGAGKSTLFQTLYRFVPPTEGRILIDGIDCATIPLARLRRAIAIIPQDPILFHGSLRSNLDRFSQFQDEDIWVALKRAHLETWVRSLPAGLDTEIKESGANFSQGQRQQLCLARALLIDTKIIVLDEATASVDVVTDSLIQETLRDECRDKTVLIIAHRLETLSLCDRVIEMRAGVPVQVR